jgi:peptidoglycan/LPS O-acetylase OafA/YrhL
LGILRTFLALCVVIEHSGGLGHTPLPGFLAVQAFYIISGFYMALVLTEKYNHAGGLRGFYKARAIRLFPIYWVVLGATIVLDLLLSVAEVPNRLDAWTSATAPGPFVMFLAVLCNIVMFGLDWFRLTMDNAHENAGGLVIVVQAWTLGVELTFYALVPLLIRMRTHWLFLVMVASFAARAILYLQGPVIHVWTNGFFPFELSLFVAGMLAYRALAGIRADQKWNGIFRRAGLPALLTILAFGFFGFEGARPVETGWGPLRDWVLLLMIALSLPALFLRFGKARFDDAVGQFSYPVYMLHFLVVTIVAAVMPKDLLNIVYLVVPLSLLGSAWLVQTFEAPRSGLGADSSPAARAQPAAILRLGPVSGSVVLVTERGGQVQLHMPGLRLTASGVSVQRTYLDLMGRKARRGVPAHKPVATIGGRR